MSRSRSRLAADWFAKLRVNATTQAVEHEDVATVEAEVTNVVTTDVAAKLDITNYTASDVLTKVKTVDGAGSGLDADTLDGQHASAFQPAGSYLTGNQTITLTGDVSGSGTTSIAVTIADDSHNHIIANVDGLQAALDGKLSTTGKAADSNLLDGLDSTAFIKKSGDNMSGNLGINNGSPTIYLQDTNNRSSMIHCNSNIFYILRGSTTNSTSWATYNGHWPLTINLENNDANFGGNLTAVGNVTAYSDERLKSNIKTIEGAVDKVKALRGVTFEKDGKANLGVIAQEVQKVLPEVVQEGEEYLSVAYGNMVGLLIEAIKEQQTQIDELKAKLEG